MQLEISNDEKIIKIKVIPRAKKTEYLGIMSDGTRKIKLKAVPEDGKANDELLRFLEEVTGKKWEIVGGWTSTRKNARIIDNAKL